jgi:hypothetical protein
MMETKPQPQPEPPDSTPEECLHRLVGCMKSSEQAQLLNVALEMLSSRCSFNPFWRLLSQDSLEEELRESDLNQRLIAARPADWPGQEIVDLDFLGDPEFWLGKVLGEQILEVLFGEADLELVTEEMAMNYLFELHEQGFPDPSDYNGDPSNEEWSSDFEFIVQQEFVAFLRQWRERVLNALESQNPADGNDN